MRYEQSPKMIEFRYRILSFNVILGLVGGISGAIMTILHISIGWYARFTFQRSMIRKLYTEEASIYGEHENPSDIKDRLSKFKPFVYNLKELILMRLINIFTCWQICGCCKRDFIAHRRERHSKFKKAKLKLAQEFDLLELIKRVRILSMLTAELFAQR